MTLHPCARERELVELLRLGHWPNAASEELRAHVYACRTCGDLALVTETFHAARGQMAPQRPFQSPGVLWWRAQLRRQNEAVARLNRPIWGAHVFALIVNVALAVGFLVVQARHGLRWLDWFSGPSGAQTSYIDAVQSVASAGSGWGLAALVSGLGLLALLSGVVLYLATDRQ